LRRKRVEAAEDGRPQTRPGKGVIASPLLSLADTRLELPENAAAAAAAISLGERGGPTKRDRWTSGRPERSGPVLPANASCWALTAAAPLGKTNR
jgi:hypothetical protein